MLEKFPPELQTAIRSELKAFERVRWAAQPIPRRMMRKALPILFFAIPWTAFALFWMAMAFTMVGTPKDGKIIGIVFPLFGLPFVLIGFAMLSAPWWAARTAKRTVYVLTDNRALIITVGRSIRTQSYRLDQLKERTKRTNADGSGDLIFSRESYCDSDGDRRTRTHGFEGVPDVRAAERMLDSVIEAYVLAQQPAASATGV